MGGGEWGILEAESRLPMWDMLRGTRAASFGVNKFSPRLKCLVRTHEPEPERTRSAGRARGILKAESRLPMWDVLRGTRAASLEVNKFSPRLKCLVRTHEP